MKVSSRTTIIQASPLRKLMPFAETAKSKGVKIYHLNIGQPDLETPEVMLNIYKNFDQKVLAYGPSQGIEIYRENLSAYYKKHKIDIEPEELIVTTAGSEALIFALLSTCDVGDEIIIPEPFYTNYNGFATIAGVTIKSVTTHIEDGFSLPSKEKFQELITSKTKAIMLCNPGNPTGAVYTKKEIEMVAKLAIENDLFVISDEVYREFVYEGAKHTSILNVKGMEKNAIIVDSVSKRYSACGARVGCLVSKNKEIIAGTLKYAMARLCPPTIDQYAANAATSLSDDYFEKNILEYQKRRDIVFDVISNVEGVVCTKPKGAFYIIAKLPLEDAEDFVKWMLTDFSDNNETTMVAPAAGFYASKDLGKNEIRIAYILNENSLRRAMEILIKGLKVYCNQK